MCKRDNAYDQLITVRAVAHYDPPNDVGPLLCMIVSLAFLFTRATYLQTGSTTLLHHSLLQNHFL